MPTSVEHAPTPAPYPSWIPRVMLNLAQSSRVAAIELALCMLRHQHQQLVEVERLAEIRFRVDLCRA